MALRAVSAEDGYADACSSDGNVSEAAWEWTVTTGAGTATKQGVGLCRVLMPPGATRFRVLVSYPGGYQKALEGAVAFVTRTAVPSPASTSTPVPTVPSATPTRTRTRTPTPSATVTGLRMPVVRLARTRIRPRVVAFRATSTPTPAPTPRPATLRKKGGLNDE
jgi:hypothetical protein